MAKIDRSCREVLTEEMNDVYPCFHLIGFLCGLDRTRLDG